jgi:hypothetical protein
VPKVPGRKQRPGHDLLECLRDRQADVLRFTTDLRIPPTSNQAERDLRPAKTQQKISGRLRSEQVTRDRYAIRGYISIVAKHGAHVLTAIHDASSAIPGCPPSPARRRSLAASRVTPHPARQGDMCRGPVRLSLVRSIPVIWAA